MRAPRRERGFILLVVLMLLLVLTVVASISYMRASDQLIVSGGLKRQALAQDRALLGMQRAVADVKRVVKPPYLAALNVQPVCPSTVTDPLACFGTTPPLTKTETIPGNDLSKGEGPQYLVEVVRWAPPGGSDALVVIRSTGFHGMDPTANPGSTQFTSQVMVEMTEGKANEAGCVGYCGGGL